MRPSVKNQRVKFWCLYCTKLAPISNREAIDLPRAARVVMLTFCVRIGVRMRLGPRSYLARANPKISLPFFAAPPHTPPPKGEKKKGNFWFASAVQSPKAS